MFLTDPQLGCYASFSGMTEVEAASYLGRGMRVRAVPRVRGFDWDAAHLRAAIAVANAMRPDLVVIGGDLIDDQRNVAQRAEFLRIVAALAPDIPLRWVPGNHDVAFDGISPTPESIEAYRRHFGDDYFVIERDDATLICLNTVVIQHPEHVPEEWAAQLEFLETALARARRGPVILIGHHPLFSRTPDEPDEYWNIPFERRRLILELVRRHKVRAGFAGHMHRNALATDGAFEMVTSGPVGFPLGLDPSGYRIVDVEGGELRHEYHALDL